MKMKQLLILSFLVLAGCAGLRTREQTADLEKELTPQPVEQVIAQPAPVVEEKKEPVAATDEAEPLTRYSQLNNMAPPSDRQYKRMTRKRMEEESDLNSSAGSLWKMEGQTSYLFSENKHRREGDPTVIKMEGAAMKLVESKAWVISDLLGQLEEQRIMAEEDARAQTEEKLRLSQLEDEKKLRAERIAKGEIVVDPMDEQQQLELDRLAAAAARKPASAQPVRKEKEERLDLKEVELIPSRIVEKMPDDTYRIRGQQYLTIKKKPYKVIATALIRAEDFNDDGVSSNKLIEAQYDVIHVKRAAQ